MHSLYNLPILFSGSTKLQNCWQKTNNRDQIAKPKSGAGIARYTIYSQFVLFFRPTEFYFMFFKYGNFFRQCNHEKSGYIIKL